MNTPPGMTIHGARAIAERSLFLRPNVVGVAVGGKNGDFSIPTVTVLVERKIPFESLSIHEVIPREVSGFPTDVIEVGHLRAQDVNTGRYRPVPAGVSLGHYLITAGTLGAFVKDSLTGETLILSNNHVMADENGAQLNDPILQPGPYDGGHNPADVVATLERYMRIGYDGSADGPALVAPGEPPPTPEPPPDNPGCLPELFQRLSGAARALAGESVLRTEWGQPIPPQATTWANRIDAALARPADGIALTGDILDIGTIEGTKPAALGRAVRKSGRTTGLTGGTIIALNATVTVGYGGNNSARFVGQIVTGNMSAPGDSGSLLVDGVEDKAVGLLFAGSDQATIFNPIDAVCELLGVMI